MKLQIKNLFLVSPLGKLRQIDFLLDSVNIITGRSKTGKSAIFDIVRYCLASDAYTIPEGPVSDCTAWFAVKLACETEEILIARKNASWGNRDDKPNRQRPPNAVYFTRGRNCSLPPIEKIQNNLSIEALVGCLNEMLGISSGIKVHEEISERNNRYPYGLSVRQALWLCIQEKSTLGDKDALFGISNSNMPTFVLREVLPFYLGLISDADYRKQQRIKTAKRELLRIRQNRVLFNASNQALARRAAPFLEEAFSKGLISEDDLSASSLADIRTVLHRAIKRNETNSLLPEERTIDDLFSQKREVLARIQKARNELRYLETLKKSTSDFETEIKSRKSRLESIQVFPKSEDSFVSVCPLCDSPLVHSLPSIQAIKNHICDIDEKLQLVWDSTPNLEIIIQKKQEEIDQDVQTLRMISSEIQRQQSLDQNLFHNQELEMQRAWIKGRLSVFLESLPESDAEQKQMEIEEQRLKIEIKSEDAFENISELKTQSALIELSREMSRMAKEMQLEHAEGNVIFDLQKLTIQAETDGRFVSLSRMGSSDNYVGYHLVFFLALHSYLRKTNAIVPAFLLLDQPSQSYYPPETTDDEITKKLTSGNSDVLALRRIFTTILNEAKGTQVIIVEHANIDEKWFQDCVRENWWQDNGQLIPKDWIEDLKSGKFVRESAEDLPD